MTCIFWVGQDVNWTLQASTLLCLLGSYTLVCCYNVVTHESSAYVHNSNFPFYKSTMDGTVEGVCFF